MPSDRERDLQAVSSERVERTLEDLHERYDGFEYAEFEVENDRELFESGYDLVAEGFVGGAAAWVGDEEGRVLMIRHPGESAWGIPGGGHEPDHDDSLEDAARREAFEETGVRVEITDCFRAHLRTFFLASDPDQRLHMVEAWFEARRVGGELELDPSRWEDDEEIADAQWMAAPPDEVIDVLGPQVERWDWPGE